MITIKVDGITIESEFNNLQALLDNCHEVNHLLEKKYAILLNQNFIAKSEYSSTPLKHMDHIQVFVPIQGG